MKHWVAIWAVLTVVFAQEQCTTTSMGLADPTCKEEITGTTENALQVEVEVEPSRQLVLDEVVSIDRSNFPSFEEWRKMNLEKTGQQAEQLEERQENVTATQEPVVVEAASEGKVYKDRFNFASFDCAATIMKTNLDTKGASNILSENKDTYLLNKCSSANKFIVVELCNDILVDTVSIANYEFFSSMFRHIRISVADRFPANAQAGWKVVGEFEGASVRDLQHFSIKNPMIWARYVQIEFLTHWGHEYYCPVSLVRVHGTTMMDEYRSQEKQIPFTKQQHRQAEQPIQREQETGSPVTATEADSESNKAVVDLVNQSEEVDWSSMFSEVNMSKNVSPLVLNESFCWDVYIQQHVVQNDTANATEPTQEPIQDSIYQTIMKRLSLLENNATLSLKYIEEQSRNLRDVLFKIEKKQNLRIELFFGQLNASVITQLQFFQQQYSNLLMETVVDLERHRKKSEQDVLALSSRLSLLADEMMYQKQIGMAQAIILLVILVFVVMNRGPAGVAPISPQLHHSSWRTVSVPETPAAHAAHAVAAAVASTTSLVAPDDTTVVFPREADPSVAFMHSDSEIGDVPMQHLRSRSMPALDQPELEDLEDLENLGESDDSFDSYNEVDSDYNEAPYPSPEPERKL